MRRVFFGIILLIVVVAVVAIWWRDGVDPVETSQLEVGGANEAATPAPTVSLPEAAPTEIPPTVSVSTATPTQTRPPASPTPAPSPTPVVYVIEEFDTLLGIAIEFDTTVEALTGANGIGEGDFLQIGQELLIPTGAETATNEEADPADQFEPPGTPESSPAELTAETEPSSEDSAATAAVQDAGGAVESVEVVEIVSELTAESGGESTAELAGTAAPQVAATGQATPISDELPALNIARPANINPLTGLAVDDPDQLQRRPLLVRIGNDTGTRQSQAGLNSADIVYEEITEWWVTRFTAIYLAEAPRIVAPIRSARLINVQLVPQYQGALAHSGGSDPVRWEISQAPMVNLDEFYSPLPYFYRPNEGWQTRLAIDTVAARDFMVAQNTEAPVSLHGFQFSDRVDTGEPADNIYIPYPRATSFTQWRYDPASGKYLRWANASPLYDANGLGQVAASNVIVYFAQHQETDIVEDANGATSIRIQVNGRGPAWFFRDGKLNKGFWQTDGTRTPYFGYADGSPYELKPGNTWIEVVPTYYTIGLNSPDEASASP
jgi:LysM repeat protein